MERKKMDPALVAESAGQKHFHDPRNINDDLGNIKPLGSCVSSLIAGWNRELREDMPSRIDRAWLCNKPLELTWEDVDLLGDCFWSLWIGNVARILVEDADLAEYLITKIRNEGVLKTLPEMRVRGGGNG